MLSRDIFKDRLSKIKEYFDFIDKLYDMGVRIEGQYSYDIINTNIESLEDLMEDNCRTIFYYIYDCNWGKEGENSVTINDKYVPFSCFDDLYDVLITKPIPEETKTILVNINYGWNTGNRTINMKVNKKYDDFYIRKEIKHWIDSQISFNYEILK